MHEPLLTLASTLPHRYDLPPFTFVSTTRHGSAASAWPSAPTAWTTCAPHFQTRTPALRDLHRAIPQLWYNAVFRNSLVRETQLWYNKRWYHSSTLRFETMFGREMVPTLEMMTTQITAGSPWGQGPGTGGLRVRKMPNWPSSRANFSLL